MTVSENPQQATSCDRFRTDQAMIRLSIAVELLLIAVTWRLWFAASAFPRVPIFGWLHGCPVEVIRAISGAFVCSLVVLGLRTVRSTSLPGRLSTWMTVCLSITTVCCNQHCLQPWHWLFLLMTGARLSVPDDEFGAAVRRIVPWIYVFAAVSRFGPGIDSGMSRQIVVTLLDLANLPLVAARSSTVTLLCVTATLVELAAGICLLTHRFRKVGVLLAVLMHASLILALGPTGLQQETGVLIWNGYLACLAIQLWWKPLCVTSLPSVPTRAVSAFCFVWPALSLFGITHNWTGWQVYSPRPEVLQLQVHLDAIPQLPESLETHVDSPQPLQDWSTVRLDRWCLQETGAPMYPQAGFQLSVALDATGQVQDSNHVRAHMIRPQTPLWWKRQHEKYLDRSAMLDSVR